MKNNAQKRFDNNTERSQGPNGWQIKCKRGLWSVQALNLSTALEQAEKHYFASEKEGFYGEVPVVPVKHKSNIDKVLEGDLVKKSVKSKAKFRSKSGFCS